MFVTGLPTSDGRQQVRSPVNVWGRDGRLIVEPLLVQRLYFACRPDHPLTEEASPTIERALEFPLVAALLRGEHAVLATGDAKAGDFTPQILVNSTSLSRLIARECDVLFPATAAMIADDVAAGRLIRLDCDAPAMRTNPGLLYLKHRTLAPAAVEFIRILKLVEQKYRKTDLAYTAASAIPRRPRKSRARRS